MLKCISNWSLDHTEQQQKTRQIHTMLDFQDTGQFVKGQCTFVQGVKFSNSSDLDDIGLKLLHVKYKEPYNQSLEKPHGISSVT